MRTANKTAPWYYTYAATRMAELNYRLMSLEERGLYFTLMNECWVNTLLPSDIESLASLIGKPVEHVRRAYTHSVAAYFTEEAGSLYSQELEGYRAKFLARHEAQVAGAKVGAERARKKRVALQSEGDDSSGPPHGQPSGSSTSLKSKSIKSTSVIKKDEVEPTNSDQWLEDYERASRGF
jgi:uncharacterized protein YdaU (DUF1376 family)